MSIDEELEKLKEEVPAVNENLDIKIYKKFQGQKNPLKRPIINRFTVSIAGGMALVILLIIGIFSFQHINQKTNVIQLKKRAKVSAPIMDPTYESFADSYNQFAIEMAATYEKYYEDKQNTVISPLSIYSALALATECSEGDTRSELLNALGTTYEQLSKNYTTLYRLSNKEIYNSNDQLKCAEKLSNSIWINKDFEVKEDALDKLSKNFYCDSFHVNFKKFDLVNQYIQKYVKKETNNLIDRNFKIGENTEIMLMNCLYLKDTWNFNGGDLSLSSKTYSFTNSDLTTTNKKFLVGKYFPGQIGETEEMQFFYTKTSNKYKLTFIVPKKEYTTQDIFTAEQISKVMNWQYADLEKSSTLCIFPEFRASSYQSLKNMLQQEFNMASLFDNIKCNFSNLSPSPIYCSDIVHTSVLKVDKKGIEGAAVTIASGDAMAAPGQYEFVIDRDFGFILQDPNDTILFSGIIDHI